jgi:hypothetical protein
MKRYIKPLSAMFSLLLWLSATAFGQETTGNIEGTVTDPAGARVAGATVELVGETGRRTVTADSEGFFRAQQLPVGIYTVNVTGGSFQPFSRKNVQVILGQTTPVNVTLAVAGTTAEVVVTDTDQLAIDPTSSRIQTNLTERELELLPKGNNVTSALRAVPSVRPEPSAAGFSVDGATGVENSFIIDGQEVSNFRTGGLNQSNNLPFELVRELQVKNSGFEAEFGGATGGVVNIVTKSGANQWHGDFGVNFNVRDLGATARPILRADETQLEYIFPTKDQGVDFFPTASLSGPVIKDRLWFFASATPQYLETIRNWTFPDGTRGQFRRQDQNDYYFARVDAAITDKLRLYSTFTYNPTKVNGLVPTFNILRAATTLGASAAVTEFNQSQLGGRVAANNVNVSGSYVATSNLVFSARWSRGYLNERFDYSTNAGSFGVPTVTRFQCVTAGFQCAAGFNNVPSNDNLLKDISIRQNFDADASIGIDNFGGRHQFKVGYQRFHVFNEVATGYVEPGRVLFNFGLTTTADDGTVFGNRPGEVGYARLVMIGEFGEASSRNEAIYIQDSWQPFRNLTLNLGLRTERENVPSFTPGFEGISFDFGDKIAPRLGFAWDVFSNGKVKVFGNYGQFFDRFKYELPRGSFGGNIFDDYRAPLLASMPDIFAYTKEYVLANSLVYTNFRVPSNDPSDFRVDPDLKPVRQTEYTFGTEVDLGSDTILRARYTHKQLDTTIEDIGYHDENDDEAYFIGNPGMGICEQAACGRYEVGAPAAKAKRKYDALEVVLDKRFARNFALNASYTLSRLFGNYSGLASTDEFSVNAGIARDSPNVNRFFDTPFDGYNVGGEPNDGRLPTDRPHVFKMFASYTFNNQDSFIRLPSSNEFELSGFFTAQSGTPITTRVDLIDNAYIPLFGRGDLGRTEMYSQTDLAATWRYRFGRDNRWAVRFNVDVLNVFNENNVLGVFEGISSHVFDVSDFPGVTITDRQDFDRAFFDGRITADRILSVLDVSPGINTDARYLSPQTFQGPRTIRFGFGFQF